MISPALLFLTLLPLFSSAQQTTTNLNFYFHDIVAGSNATSVQVVSPVQGTSSSPTTMFSFGAVRMIDNLLTESPDPTSKAVGRAQGFYASAAQSDISFLMAMNLCFNDELYNGSTIAVLGHNPPTDATRELPIVGGSGKFRMGKGYAVISTTNYDAATGNAVVNYNVTVVTDQAEQKAVSTNNSVANQPVSSDGARASATFGFIFVLIVLLVL